MTPISLKQASLLNEAGQASHRYLHDPRNSTLSVYQIDVQKAIRS